MKAKDKVIVLDNPAFTSSKESYKGKVGIITKIIVNKGKIQPIWPVWVKFDLTQFEQKCNESDANAPFKFTELAVVEE
jgi:hypothetical protein